MPGELLPLATALGVGLLVGAERERRKSESVARAAAGIRTFALAALTGALALRVGGELLLAVALLGTIALAAIGYSHTRDDDPGLTTEVALVLTTLLGAVATREPALAAGLAVTVTILLAARMRLHHFVRSGLSQAEVNDALLIAAATLVILPLIPDRHVGPLQAINPRTVWLLVVLAMAIGAVGHIGQRMLGTRYGLPLAGFVGGFVSSSATIGSMGALARRDPAVRAPAVGGAVLSSVATVVHLAVVLAATSPATLRSMMIPIAMAGAVAVLYGAFFMLRPSLSEQAQERAPGHAFSVPAALGLALLLTVVLLLSALLDHWLGVPGITVAAGLAGFADAQSAAISATSLVSAGKLGADDAVFPILVGLSTNTLTKLAFAWTAGGARYTLQLAPGLALMLAAAWLGAWIA